VHDFSSPVLAAMLALLAPITASAWKLAVRVVHALALLVFLPLSWFPTINLLGYSIKTPKHSLLFLSAFTIDKEQLLYQTMASGFIESETRLAQCLTLGK
jgi:hypothetical protein